MKRFNGVLMLSLLTTGSMPAAAAEEVPVWSLGRCLELARERNLELRTAEAEADLAGAGEESARAERRPALGAAGDFGWVSDVMHIDMPATDIPGAGISIPGRSITVGGRDSYDLALTLRYPVDAGGRLRSRIRAAGSAHRADRLTAEATGNRVVFEVARAYLELFKAKLQLETAEAARAQVAAHLDDVRNYHAQGMLPENEILRTGVELARIDVMINEARHSVRLRRVALLNLLDMDLSAEFEIADGLPDGPAEVIGEIGDAVPEASRPELEAVSFRINAARDRVQAARAGARPNLALFGSTNYGKPGLDRFRNEWMGYLRVGLSADLSLWDGGRVETAVAREETSLRLAELRQEQLAKAIESDRIGTELTLDNASRRYDLDLQALEQSEENFRMVESRFKQGLEPNTEYLRAQTDLTRARLEAESARVDLLVARADYRRALGAFRRTANPTDR